MLRRSKPFRSAGAGRLTRWLAAFVVVSALLAATPAQADLPDRRTAAYEVRFLTRMIDHHAMAVEMAALCVDRAAHGDLAAFCSQMGSAQEQEMAIMQGWLWDWYGIQYQPRMTQGQQNQMRRLSSLAGPAFEIQFMEQMIRHHWRAVVMARQCVDRAYHDELAAAAQAMVDSQTDEIRQMQDWLCGWYDLCGYGPQV